MACDLQQEGILHLQCLWLLKRTLDLCQSPLVSVNVVEPLGQIRGLGLSSLSRRMLLAYGLQSPATLAPNMSSPGGGHNPCGFAMVSNVPAYLRQPAMLPALASSYCIHTESISAAYQP